MNKVMVTVEVDLEDRDVEQLLEMLKSHREFYPFGNGVALLVDTYPITSSPTRAKFEVQLKEVMRR